MSIDFITYPKGKNEFLKDFFSIRQFVSNNIDLVKKHGLFKDILKDDYDKAIKEMNEKFNKYLEKISDINEYFYSNAVKYCIKKFIDAEMDYATPGIRGLGRMSTFFPRFGGFYSKFLKKLSTDELRKIESTIFEIIKYGYTTRIFMEMFLEKELKNLNNINIELLFQKWIPEIYVTDFTNNSLFSSFLDQSVWDSMIYFCFKISEETNFPKKFLALRYARDSKLALIIDKYVQAGFILRLLESKLGNLNPKIWIRT